MLSVFPHVQKTRMWIVNYFLLILTCFDHVKCMEDLDIVLILGGAYLITTVFAGWVNNVERAKMTNNQPN